MDLTPMASGPKCGGSDFSIERILSEDSSRDSDTPSWLCCTRYRPPRLPRASTACRSRRSGRHARVPFTSGQAAALEAAYARSPYLAPPALRALAAALQLRDDRIKIWFQNRRARERREKSGSIAPPQAVTLPATTITSFNGTWVHTAPYNYQHNENSSQKRPNLCPRDSELDSLAPILDTSDENRPESPVDIETVEE